MTPAPRLLLLSSSRVPGREEFLTWAGDDIRDFLGGVRTVTFVPYAAVTLGFDDYAARVREAFGALGYETRSVHAERDLADTVRRAEAIVVGGGNTFHLLHLLDRTGLLQAIGERVRGGVPFIGWSAGSNVACPTIRTTNDMPIVEVRSLRALGLVPFQINPHYNDHHPPGFRGETRADRLNEFIALERDVSVVGLREGGILRLEGSELALRGLPDDAVVYRHGGPPRTVRKGDDLAFLMRGE